MNPKILIINLIKDINKFFLLNIGALMLILSFSLLVGLHNKKEIILLISVAVIASLMITLGIIIVMKRKMEKTIQQSFEKIEMQLYFDELTSVYNRTAGMNRLLEEMARARRNGKSLSIAMIDIDNFKSINDTYGHLAGDKVLGHVAMQIKNILRVSDVVSRYGGEEFLIILPETDEIKAFMALERVRESISKKPFKVGNERIYTSVSIGVTEVDAEENSFEAIQRADRALYQAKRSGKNKIEIAGKTSKNRLTLS